MIGKRFNHTFHLSYATIGGAAIDQHNNPLPDETIEMCENSDAVILGAVGGPKWDNNPPELRPEKDYYVFANTSIYSQIYVQ